MTAAKLSVIYGVSEKAVRDIWTGRTWAKETWHLDMSRPITKKHAGRPKGSKDKIPRRRRSIGDVKEGERNQQFAQPKILSSIPQRITDCVQSLDEQIFDWESNYYRFEEKMSCDPFREDWEQFVQRCKIVDQKERLDR